MDWRSQTVTFLPTTAITTKTTSQFAYYHHNHFITFNPLMDTDHHHTDVFDLENEQISQQQQQQQERVKEQFDQPSISSQPLQHHSSPKTKMPSALQHIRENMDHALLPAHELLATDPMRGLSNEATLPFDSRLTSAEVHDFNSTSSPYSGSPRSKLLLNATATVLQPQQQPQTSHNPSNHNGNDTNGPTTFSITDLNMSIPSTAFDLLPSADKTVVSPLETTSSLTHRFHNKHHHELSNDDGTTHNNAPTIVSNMAHLFASSTTAPTNNSDDLPPVMSSNSMSTHDPSNTPQHQASQLDISVMVDSFIRDDEMLRALACENKNNNGDKDNDITTSENDHNQALSIPNQPALSRQMERGSTSGDAITTIANGSGTRSGNGIDTHSGIDNGSGGGNLENPRRKNINTINMAHGLAGFINDATYDEGDAMNNHATNTIRHTGDKNPNKEKHNSNGKTRTKLQVDPASHNGPISFRDVEIHLENNTCIIPNGEEEESENKNDKTTNSNNTNYNTAARTALPYDSSQGREGYPPNSKAERKGPSPKTMSSLHGEHKPRFGKSTSSVAHSSCNQAVNRGNNTSTTANTNNTSGGSSCGLTKRGEKRKPRTYSQAIPSQHCHICSRRPTEASPHAVCGNLLKGRCRKTICTKCFLTFRWDLKAAREGEPGSWECPHCRGECPQRAQCVIYNRTSDRRRLKLINHRKRKAEAAAATVNTNSTETDANGNSSKKEMQVTDGKKRCYGLSGSQTMDAGASTMGDDASTGAGVAHGGSVSVNAAGTDDSPGHVRDHVQDASHVSLNGSMRESHSTPLAHGLETGMSMEIKVEEEQQHGRTQDEGREELHDLPSDGSMRQALSLVPPGMGRETVFGQLERAVSIDLLAVKGAELGILHNHNTTHCANTRSCNDRRHTNNHLLGSVVAVGGSGGAADSVEHVGTGEMTHNDMGGLLTDGFLMEDDVVCDVVPVIPPPQQLHPITIAKSNSNVNVNANPMVDADIMKEHDVRINLGANVEAVVNIEADDGDKMVTEKQDEVNMKWLLGEFGDDDVNVDVNVDVDSHNNSHDNIGGHDSQSVDARLMEWSAEQAPLCQMDMEAVHASARHATTTTSSAQHH